MIEPDATTDDAANKQTVTPYEAPPLDTLAPTGQGLDVATPDALVAPQPFTSDPGQADPGNSEQLVQAPGGISNPFTLGTATGGSTAFRSRVISYGLSLIGLPYVWGGTSTKTGLDCSGLVLAAYGRFGVSMPRISYQQANKGQMVPLKFLQPGDLVAWDENSRNNGADHIAIYIGNGQILESPHTGASVRVRTLGKNEGAWGVHLTLPGDK